MYLLFMLFIYLTLPFPSLFLVEIAQTGTILPCICCIWDSIPWTLVRILFWCADEEMPMRPMSLQRIRGKKTF